MQLIQNKPNYEKKINLIYFKFKLVLILIYLNLIGK